VRLTVGQVRVEAMLIVLDVRGMGPPRQARKTAMEVLRGRYERLFVRIKITLTYCL
jgi:hypothetical protein